MDDRSGGGISPSNSSRFRAETDAIESPVTSPPRPRPPLSLEVIGSPVYSPPVRPLSIPGSPSFESRVTAPSIVPPIPPSPKFENNNVSNNSYIESSDNSQNEYDDYVHSSEGLEDLELEVEQTHLKLKSMGLTTTDLSYSI